MRKTWSWYGAEAALFGSLLSLLVLPATAPAATILEKRVEIRLESPAKVVETTRLRVRLDSHEDVEAWEYHAVVLDENRQLRSAKAVSTSPGGKRVPVGRKEQDTVGLSGGDVFHTSQHAEVFTFSELAVGSTVEIETEVETAPYFPAGALALREDDPIAALEVRLEPGGQALRYALDGPREGLEIDETADAVILRAHDLPAVDPPPLAPGGPHLYTVLHYSWGGEGSWDGVGRWYGELLAGLERDAAAVRQQAQALTAGLDDPRQRLEALLAFARQQVRYVAVEVGIGGYEPSPAAAVLERRWGDCKDKSLLLVDLLRAVGIEAHPALIRLGRRERVAAGFASPHHFNHLIVAVPQNAVATTPEDPVRDGFLFLDPTQTRGKARFLHPGVQGQSALVVTPDGGQLVTTPVLPELEHRLLRVQLSVEPDGTARGGAAFEVRGDAATGFLAQTESAAPERSEEDVRAIFAALLPGVELGAVAWQAEDGEVPTVTMMAPVLIEGLVQGLDSGSPSFALGGPREFPSPRRLGERGAPVVLSPGTTTAEWSFVLPEGWCRPEARERGAENEIGSFVQRVALAENPQRFTVKRQVELLRRWVEPEEVEALRELALAEYRSHRRRVRLRCE